MGGRIGTRVVGLRLLLVAPLLAAAVAFGAPTPAGAAFECTVTKVGGTIRDSVVVPAGARCDLTDVVVRGGVTVVGPRSEFVARGGEIRGSVTATGHGVLYVGSTEVRGSVTATGGTYTTALAGTVVRGDVRFVGNGGVDVILFGATVGGSATVSDNLVEGDNGIAANAIGGHLVCAGNFPAPPNDQAPNTVGGAKTGQCAGL